MSALCRIGWHAWGRWKPTRTQRGGKGPVMWGQFRTCRNCGRDQVR